MPRRSSQERRRQVLDAAARLLVREGAAATSVRRVAEEAGMSTGSLRHIFPSHEDLLLALLTEGEERITRHRDALRARPELSRDTVVELLLELLPTTAESRADLLARLSVHTTHPGQEKLRRAGVAAAAQLDELCQAIVTATCPPEDVAPAALELRLVLDGLSLRLLEDPDFDAGQARDVLCTRLRKLCFL